MNPAEQAGLAVSRYLRPEEQVVPFLPRPELDELLNWCSTGGHAAVRLVAGDGGAGKTRLALRLCEDLAANGWEKLWVPRGSERDAVRDARELDQPSLLVVDYAETRGDLGAMLSEVAADTSGPDVRVILLARGSGEWWQRLVSGSDEPTARLLALPPVILGPIAVEGGPAELFAEALAAFATRLAVARPDVEYVLADREPLVLVVQAAALLAVLDHAFGGEGALARSAAEVLDGLLAHEGRYWVQSAAARGLDLDVSVQRFAVAIGCLIGADDETAATGLMSRIPDLADSAERRGQVARWLHDLYPEALPGQTAAGEWIGPLRPDPVAERLIVGELSGRLELISGVLSGLTDDRAARALTVLARATYTQPAAANLISTAFAADLEHLAVPALFVAVTTNPVLGELLNNALSHQAVSAGVLEQIADNLPQRTFALAPVAATVLTRLVDQATDAGQRADRLLDLSNYLHELGRRDAALTAIEEVVTIRRGQVRETPEEIRPALALALNNQARQLADLGRRTDALASMDALAPIEEAVAIRRELAQDRPDAFEPDLAMSLNNQSLILKNLGRPEEGLTAAEESVSIRRRLVQGRPDVFPALAASLNNQSLCLADLGRREEALATAQESTHIYRALAQIWPDAYLADLATSLNNQSNWLADLRRREEALAPIEEGTRIYGALAYARPDAYLPAFAHSLYNLSTRLSSLGRREQALAAVSEAARIYRSLTQAHPGAYRAELATSLNQLSTCLVSVERLDEGLAAAEESVALHRNLAQENPSAFLPGLAVSLHNQCLCLLPMGRQTEALASIKEAATIRRDLARDRPDAYRPYLALSLRIQSTCQYRVEQQAEALASIEESTHIYRALAQAYPDTFSSELTAALEQLAQLLDRLGRTAEAVEARAEADITSR
jgi:hypothetical protein